MKNKEEELKKRNRELHRRAQKAESLLTWYRKQQENGSIRAVNHAAELRLAYARIQDLEERLREAQMQCVRGYAWDELEDLLAD